MGELKDYGLQYVNPDLVDVSPPVAQAWETTKDGGGGTPRSEMAASLDHLGEVKTRLDKGYTADDFKQMRHSSDPDERAIGDSHSMFWGEHPISVTKSDDKITSDEGRHRLDLAQARGERSVPMRVHAPSDDPDFSQRPFDQARSHGSFEKERDQLMPTGEYRSGNNPVEAPELDKSPEKSPVDGMPPDLHEQYHSNTGGSDDSMTGGARDDDPMDARSESSGDTFDGADESSDRENGASQLSDRDATNLDSASSLG